MNETVDLNTKATAKLEEEVKDVLNRDIPDPSGGIASILPSSKERRDDGEFQRCSKQESVIATGRGC